jgi:hypothetical protein
MLPSILSVVLQHKPSGFKWSPGCHTTHPALIAFVVLFWMDVLHPLISKDVLYGFAKRHRGDLVRVYHRSIRRHDADTSGYTVGDLSN